MIQNSDANWTYHPYGEVSTYIHSLGATRVYCEWLSQRGRELLQLARASTTTMPNIAKWVTS
jgi:hypothetical protein